MSGDWRDSIEEEHPAFGLGDLSEGDSLGVYFQSEGKLVETKHGEALKIPVEVSEFPEGFEDMNGDTLETDETYYLMSSSSRFMRNLADLDDSLEGEYASISAEGSSFDRTYFIQK